MRKVLFAAASLAALAGVGVTGFALAQNDGPPRERGFFGADANNDGVLTRAEFDAGQTALFARLDANNDGQLTREEGRANRMMHRGGRRGGHGRGPGFDLARADANNDGNITRDEFLARPIEMFDRLDANNDGVIQASERPQRPERPEGERHRDGRGHEGRPSRDTNNDGQISRAEFVAGGAQMFQRMDANNDGRVTREEAESAWPHRRAAE